MTMRYRISFVYKITDEPTKWFEWKEFSDMRQADVFLNMLKENTNVIRIAINGYLLREEGAGPPLDYGA